MVVADGVARAQVLVHHLAHSPLPAGRMDEIDVGPPAAVADPAVGCPHALGEQFQ